MALKQNVLFSKGASLSYPIWSIARNSDWFILLFAPLVIGRSHFFGIDFSTIIQSLRNVLKAHQAAENLRDHRLASKFSLPIFFRDSKAALAGAVLSICHCFVSVFHARRTIDRQCFQLYWFTRVVIRRMQSWICVYRNSMRVLCLWYLGQFL